MKLDVLCFLHWLPWAHFRISNACNFLISVQKHKVWVLICLVRSQGKFWKLNFQDLLNFSLFYSCSYGFNFGRHCTYCNVIINMTQCVNVFEVIYSKKNVTFKIVYIIKREFNFVMTMPFISSQEVRNFLFRSWLRHSWNIHFSLHLMK